MGATLDVFTLYRLTNKGSNCEHFLLLKVTRPGYSNVAQQEEDWANDVVTMRQRILLDLYMQHLLPQDCLYAHEVSLKGEFQGYAPGDDLYNEPGMRSLDIWTAPTSFGDRWIILGTAESADAFWQEIVEDQDLAIVGVQPPVTSRHVFFLSDR